MDGGSSVGTLSTADLDSAFGLSGGPPACCLPACWTKRSELLRAVAEQRRDTFAALFGVVRGFSDRYTKACDDLMAGDKRAGTILGLYAQAAAFAAADACRGGWRPTRQFMEMLLASVTGGPSLDEMASWEWLSPHDAADAAVAAWVYYAMLGSRAVELRAVAWRLLVAPPDGKCPLCRAAGCGCVADAGHAFAELEFGVRAMAAR